MCKLKFHNFMKPLCLNNNNNFKTSHLKLNKSLKMEYLMILDNNLVNTMEFIRLSYKIKNVSFKRITYNLKFKIVI